MLGKLVKFIILSRVSEGGLIALFGFTAYIMVVDLVFFEVVRSGILKVPLYYSLGYTAAIYALFSFFGGLTVTKADLDYLFTLPIDRKTLGFALYLSGLTLSLLVMSLLVSFSFNVYLFLVSPLLGVSMVSLGQSLQALRPDLRALVVVAVAVWLVSPVWGFPYSPTSVAMGDLVQGLAVGSVYTGILVFTAVRVLGNYEQLIIRHLVSTQAEGKESAPLTGPTPLSTFLKLRLTYLPISGQLRLSWTSGDNTARVVRMRTMVFASSVVAVVYYFVFRFLEGVNQGILVPGVIIAVSYVSALGLLVGFSSLSTERSWLTVPYLGTKFLKYLVVGTWVQVIVLLLPVSVANFLLSPFNPMFLYVGLNAALVVPLVSALITYIQAATQPIQLRDEATPINVEYSARNSVPVLVAYALISLEITSVVALSLPIVLGTGLTVTVLLAWLMRDHVVRKVIDKMTEMGYV
mgnify:CR=1 FL=1